MNKDNDKTPADSKLSLWQSILIILLVTAAFKAVNVFF